MTKVTTISNSTKIDLENNCIEGVRNNQVYILDNSDINYSQHYGFDVRYSRYEDDNDIVCEINTLSELSQKQAEELFDYYLKYNPTVLTNCTAEYLESFAEQKETKRKSFLSSVFKNAWQKVKTGVVCSIRAALYNAWTEAKAVAWTVVTFYKLKTDEVTTRSVQFVEVKQNGLFLCLDKDKGSYISFHQQQLISFS